MNILFRGEYSRPVDRFKCDKCGTVWECEENEIQTEFVNNEKYVLCRCPVCRRKAIKYERCCVGNTKAIDK